MVGRQAVRLSTLLGHILKENHSLAGKISPGVSAALKIKTNAATYNRRLHLTSSSATENQSSSSAMDAFNSHGVVPDLIDETPSAMLQLKFGDIDIQPGVEMKPTKVKDPPTVHWEAEAGAFYTLIMNDPDAPSRENPKFGEWHHWLVTNIPGNDVSKGDVMSEYVGSGPPPKTGLHRYVFLVFKQSGGKQDFPGLTKLTNTSGGGRPKWKVREFAQKYNLGKPVAGNFHRAEFDDYVPLLYKQLGN